MTQPIAAMELDQRTSCMQEFDSKHDLMLDADTSDQTLVRQYRIGEEDAASKLYERYARRLQRLAFRQTSTDLSQRVGPDEIVQSVFRTFFRRVSKGQYDAITDNDLWRLFLVISLNKIRSNAEFHQAQKRDIRKTESTSDDACAGAANLCIEDEIAHTVLRMTVEELLADLPNGHDEIVRLRVQGYEISDISKITGRSRRTTERVLQRFRERLTKDVGS